MKIHRLTQFVLLVAALIAVVTANAQTSWKGTGSTSWSAATNWTAGVPTASVDAIIGDTNFTGASQPVLTVNSVCKSLTIGTGTIASTLTVAKAMAVSGNITIGTNGTVTHSVVVTISLTGNWINAGVYNPTKLLCEVTFSGAGQTIGGTTITAFKKITINSGSTVTLSTNLSVANQMTVSGTLNPGDSPTFAVSGAGKLAVNSGGKIRVKAGTFGGNYSLTGAKTLSTGSTVDYAAEGNQTVDNSLTYSALQISGGGTKTPAGSLPALASSAATAGSIEVAAGTLDLSTFTADRSAGIAGGTLTVASGATLKIGGTDSFPANYATHSLGASSTVEYSGTNQAVSAESYGNLTLSSSGAATKSLPGSTITVAGIFSSVTNGSGASVSFTAGAAITFNGSLSLGAGTTFNGGTFTHSIGGNWTNNGTFTGGGSTVTLAGTGANISGGGANNFNNLTLTGAGVTAATNTDLAVAGNLSTTGAGTFTHTSGGAGTVTMNGAGKTISGTGISFNHLAVSGSVGTSDSLTVAGNLNVTGSFSASGGTLSLSGAGRTIYGGGTIALNALNVIGSLSTTNNFSVASDVSVSGSLTATAGTATFNGTSSLSGTANLFNVTLNGTRLQPGGGAVLGIAGAFTQTAGTFDVTTTTPNTVTYNGSGAQTLLPATYDNLTLAGSGTKTAGGALTVNRDLAISSGTTFGAGAFTHSLWRNWINNGSFTASTSTIQLPGTLDSSISGATTFNALTVNKSSSVNVVRLSTNITTTTLNMTSGQMNTGPNAVTITATRTGAGVILGTITRTHAFAAGTAYAFESPNNTISFDSLGTVSSVTVTAASDSVSGFPFGGSANRQYTISLSASGGYLATLRLHYEDAELNGNTESALNLWRYSGAWAVSGKTASNTTSNWVEQSTLTDVTGRWTLSANNNVACWNGSVSTAWENSTNWTALQGAPGLPPSTNDIAELGAAAFVNQPMISSAAQARSISFGSAQAVTLTLGAGGSLTTGGNIEGNWTNNVTHTIAVGGQTLSVGGDLALSDGTSSHAIHLSLGTGAVIVSGALSESGGANVTFTGAGLLKIGGHFNYTSGTFTAGSGTVIYNGAGGQSVAGVAYNRLAFEKTGGDATLAAATTVGSDLTLTNSGTFTVSASLTVAGRVVVDTGTGLTTSGAGTTLAVGGDWTRLGAFTPGSATVALNGTGAQTVNATTFNNLAISKTSGTVALAGNLSLNGDLNLASGTLDLGTNTANRSAVGGALTLASGTTLKAGNVFPANFGTRSLAASSTVEYTGAAAQTVSGETYGNLVFSNGGSNAKTLAAATTIAGDLLINSNATFAGSSFLVTLSGNWSNSGTFNAGTGTIKLDGAGKSVSGGATFTNLTVTGSYTVAGSALIIHGNLFVTGTFDVGAGSATLDGDLINAGSLTSSGTTTFTGTRVQTLQLLGALVASSSGVINFNGSIAPVLYSTTSPRFVTVNINNTVGITPSTGWTIYGPFTVASTSAFHAGSATHNFYHAFLNHGTVTSSGTLNFEPAVSTTVKLGGVAFASTGTVRFGGASQISLAGNGGSFNAVIVANTHAAGVTANTNWTLTGGLTISSGATFHAGAGAAHTISGDTTTDGTFDGQTSSVGFNGTTIIRGNGPATFNHLTVSGTVTAESDFAVAGNFTNNGAFDATGVEVTFKGSSGSVIAGSTTPTPIDSLVIAKTSATVTLAVNVNSLTSLNVSSGTLDSSTFTLTEAASGGLTASAGTTLKLGGSNPLPTFDTYSFDPTSTVEFSGSSAQTIAAQSYGHLTSSSTGARTLASSGTIGIAGAFTPGANSYTITGSTVNFNGPGAQTIPAFNFQNLTSSSTGGRSLAAGGTIGVAGTFTPGANSFTVSGSTVNFNGSAQAIPAFAYGSLTTSGSGTKTPGGNIIVGGNLTLSAGTLAAGSTAINLAGDWANNSGATAFTAGTGTVMLNGTVVQSIAGSQLTTFNNLVVSNSAGASVNRSIRVGAGTVNSGALLLGVGPIGGAFTVNGTMTPGTNGIGTLILSNAPALAGTFLAEINPTNAQTADMLVLTTGTLTYGGALIVTNTGPAITNGSTFTLFGATNYAGGFASLTFPSGSTNHWKTNNLIANGTISFTNINPVARSLNTSVPQGGVVNVQFDLGKYKLATDADGDTMTIASAYGATNASLGVAPNGLSMSYTNTGGSPGTFDTFNFTVSDGAGGFATNAVSVRIEAAAGFNLLSASGNTLTYLGIPGANYALENTATLSPASWVPVVTNVVGADGKLIFTLQSPSGFYRTRYVNGP